MTALLSVGTPEGIILAADGRQTHSNGIIISESVQKVFPATAANLVCGWGWYGAVGHDRVSFSFDLVKATHVAIEQAKEREFGSLSAYAEEIATKIYWCLSIAYPDGFSFRLDQDGLIAGFFLAGYCNGRMQTALVELRHRDGKMQTPGLLDAATNRCGMTIGCGPECVFNALELNRPCVPPSTLIEGRKLAHKYIWTCKYNNQTVDECRGIGGRIHIAAIRPGDFQWCVPPVSQGE